MKKIYFLLFCLLCFQLNGNTQLNAVKGEADYPFLINLPSDSILNSKPPVLIFLHGRSLSGNNLEIVKRYGIVNEIIRGRKIPAIVVAPQVSMGKGWEPEKVLSVLKYVQTHYNTDSNRVYVAGMSLGGYGTLHFAGKYPELIAGAVALCGGGNISDGCNLAQIPLWIQHGKLDRAVPISESDKMVDAIKNCNGGTNLIYTVHPSYGHGELERVFHSDEFYNFLFSKIKKPSDLVKNEEEIECGIEGVD
ncbi:MAG: prolyl oligopeptidase family serine peptidase [Flavobacteriia bacterium]|nr:prolyl oligopeptidase family serine peptidase [Flavobacteriia bacterium]